MNQATRFRLQQVIDYHDAIAARHGAKIEAAEEGADTAADKKMCDLHGEVAKQLQAVLDRNPVVSGIDAARAAPDRIERSKRLFPRTGRQFVSQGMLH